MYYAICKSYAKVSEPTSERRKRAKILSPDFFNVMTEVVEIDHEIRIPNPFRNVCSFQDLSVRIIRKKHRREIPKF